MQRNEAPEITWTIPLDKANQVLSYLAEQKFKDVADIIGDLQRQAAVQLQMAQQQAKTQSPPQLVDRAS